MQALPDLEQANQDCDDFRECLLKYELMESDIMRLYDRETSSREINDMFNSISRRLRYAKQSKKENKSVQKYLIFFLFASHGILKEGRQFILLNEFNA